MKKYLFVLAGVLLACPLSAGISPTEQALADQMVARQFSVVTEDPNSCREVVEGRKYQDAIASCSKALQLYQSTMDYAKKHNVSVRPALASSKLPFITDPLILFPDLQENILFSRVMKGELKLSQALQENGSLTPQGGFVGFLRGANKKMPSAYSYVAETFRTWKGCSKALNEARRQVAIDPAGFCSK